METKKNINIWKSLQKVPAGTMFVPLIIGAIITTICQGIFNFDLWGTLGNPMKDMFSSSGQMLIIGLMLFCTGTQLSSDRQVANIISAQVILKPDSVLGLATGSSPIGIYEQLIKWYNKGDVDFGGCTTFNLDEYRGLTPDHDQSYHYFMHKNFFDAVNVPTERINLPDGAQLDAERECKRYDAAIKLFRANRRT